MGALDGNQSCLALTFDDGPDESWTNQVLDILKAYGVCATFFCIGEQVQAHTGVLRRMREKGHVVANHTWSHPRLTQISSEDLADEIERTSDVIESAINLRPRLFRPPYGDLDARVEHEIRTLGYDLVLWDVDSVDWSSIPGPTIVANVLPKLKPGAIILHHSAKYARGVVDALPYIIETSRALGYDFCTVDTLCGYFAYQS